MRNRFLSRCGAGRSKRQANSPLRNRGGFGLVEVMVAMAVIAIVTAAAVTIVMSSVRTSQKNRDQERAEYFSADAIEAFRISDDAASFINVMEFAGYTLTEEGDLYIYAFDNGYSAEVKAEYTSASGRPQLSVSVKDGEGNEVSSRSFTKGGGA